MIEQIGNSGEDDDRHGEFDPWLEELDKKSRRLEHHRRLNLAAVLLAGAAVASAALWSGTSGDSVAARDQPAASAEADPDSAASAANYPLCTALPLSQISEPISARHSRPRLVFKQQTGCQLALYEPDSTEVAGYITPGMSYMPTCFTQDNWVRLAGYRNHAVVATGYAEAGPDLLTHLESLVGPLQECDTSSPDGRPAPGR